MPLQNRVTPFGEIVATSERGTLMGNRGGRIHDEHRRLGKARWTSRRWIACELVYKDWRRPVMGEGYTELFFLDEVTALSAGHRPCFFCRRADAKAFSAAFAVSRGSAADADAMDVVLHAERVEATSDGTRKRRHRLEPRALPEGAMFTDGEGALAIMGDKALRWSPGGWLGGDPRPSGTVDVLTPPSILAVLASGYRPRWHPSAGAINPPGPQRSAC